MNGDRALATTTQPGSQTVLDGEPVTFSVSAAGKEPLSYQWLQTDGKDLTVLPAATRPTLTIPTTIYAYHNGLKYSVVVTDASGSQVTSSFAELHITPKPPVITESPLSQTVSAGSTATFSIAASGTLPLKFQWNVNGVPIVGAAGPSYTTAPLAYPLDDQASYSVTVTNGAGQTVSSPAGILTVSKDALPPVILVDCHEPDASVAHQVTYRRGVVENFDLNYSPSAIVSSVTDDIQSSGINFLNATLDINTKPDADLFDYTPGNPPKLLPDPSGNKPLEDTFELLRSSVPDTALPAAVQVSGTPFVFASELDPAYEVVCNALGNYYPLPKPGAPMQITEKAIERWISGLDTVFPKAIWIGTQEPTHTLGYSTAYDDGGCSNPTHAQLQGAIPNNIERFIAYWTPIAQYLHDRHIQTGGIQLNAGNAPYYKFAADQIIAAKMKLDYFTIQNYNPSLALNQTLYRAYEVFQQNPDYSNVKVMLDRYGTSETGGSYGTAKGVISFLRSESQLMPYADMLYSYALETVGLQGTTLLPQVMQWLQSAPAPLRPVTSTNSDLQAFALVEKDSPKRAYIALWNASKRASSGMASVVLDGLDGSFASSDLTVLKGSGSTLTKWNNSSIRVDGNTITGLPVQPDEVLLISLHEKVPEPGSLGGSIRDKSGPASARVWNFSVGNGGTETALDAQITNITLQQTHGPACTPAVAKSLAFPLLVGNIAPGTASNIPVTIDFSKCSPVAAFTVTADVLANQGAATGTIERFNQFR